MGRVFSRLVWLGILSGVLVTGLCEAAKPTNRELALRLYRRLTGVPILLSDPRLAAMEKLIGEGKHSEAAAIATDDPAFYRLTLRQWATRMSNKDLSPYVPLNDFTALVVGVARDGIDARWLLSGDFAYHHPTLATKRDQSNNSHYDELDRTRTDLKKELKRVSPQWEGVKESAGLLTTRAWAEAHYNMGTNRRALQFLFQEFLCTPIEGWRESNLPDVFVRRDVDRKPSGDPANYQTACRTCHAPMDAMAGAFNRVDFVQNRFESVAPNGIVEKVNRNATMYPEGFVSIDDSWAVPDTEHQHHTFGWRGDSLKGLGIKALGKLVANSERFKSCMAERAFKEICHRDATADEKKKELKAVADNFEKGKYKLRGLFQDVATMPGCLGHEQEETVNAGINQFRQQLEFLAVATGIDPLTPEINTYYQGTVTRLPKTGSVEEMNATALIAVTALSGLFCKNWLVKEAGLGEEARSAAFKTVKFDADSLDDDTAKAVIAELSKRFWQRDITNEERDALLETTAQLRALKDKGVKAAETLHVLCSTMASSLDSMVR